MTRPFDAVIVGSGINSLACGALLARGGWGVCILEREAVLGGAIRTEELTEPGFRHDVFSGWHPLWVGGPAHAELADELAARGLEYLNTELPTGTAFPDGSSAFLLRSVDENAAELGEEWRGFVDSFAPNADLAFGLLGVELWSWQGLRLGAKALRRLGVRGLVEYTGETLVSSRDWLTETFPSERARGVLAPWVLHTGLGPDAAGSGFMNQAIAFAIQEGGMPIPRGGGARLVDALVALIRDHGGVVEAGRDVDRVLIEDGRAAGVRMADGEEVRAQRAVIANVTPTQLYGRLLPGKKPVRYRYGRGDMQIHLALSEPPRWDGDERLGRTAIVHVTPGLDGVSRAVNEADRGLLPEEGTIVVGQPLTIDPSRAPEGRGLLWLQLQELPRGHPWTEDERERYADHVLERLGRHIPNLQSALIGRAVLSPADLERANVNLVGGDPYSGSLTLDQSFLWRPLSGRPGHSTHLEGLWHIGASTHPGPGLGGGSGTIVARRLLR
jgi:phytoene dehydrogenase-like protein